MNFVCWFVVLQLLLVGSVTGYCRGNHGRIMMRVENTNNQFINNEIRKKINTFISKKFHILPVITSLCIATNPAFADVVKAPWSADTQLEIVKGNQDAPMPKAGDLVAIRFKGSYKGNPFDDTFSTDQPYLYRCGVGGILKGLDDTVVNMHLGDRYKVSFGGDLAFGAKGRPSAPGKPRIPANAVIDYEVELVDLPGQGDDFIADVE